MDLKIYEMLTYVLDRLMYMFNHVIKTICGQYTIFYKSIKQILFIFRNSSKEKKEKYFFLVIEIKIVDTIEILTLVLFLATGFRRYHLLI